MSSMLKRYPIQSYEAAIDFTSPPEEKKIVTGGWATLKKLCLYYDKGPKIQLLNSLCR